MSHNPPKPLVATLVADPAERPNYTLSGDQKVVPVWVIAAAIASVMVAGFMLGLAIGIK